MNELRSIILPESNYSYSIRNEDGIFDVEITCLKCGYEIKTVKLDTGDDAIICQGCGTRYRYHEKDYIYYEEQRRRHRNMEPIEKGVSGHLTTQEQPLGWGDVKEEAEKIQQLISLYPETGVDELIELIQEDHNFRVVKPDEIYMVKGKFLTGLLNVYARTALARKTLYDKLPTGTVDAMTLINLIQGHLEKLDDILKNQ